MLRFSTRRMTAAFATQLALQTSTKQSYMFLGALAIHSTEDLDD